MFVCYACNIVQYYFNDAKEKDKTLFCDLNLGWCKWKKNVYFKFSKYNVKKYNLFHVTIDVYEIFCDANGHKKESHKGNDKNNWRAAKQI